MTRHTAANQHSALSRYPVLLLALLVALVLYLFLFAPVTITLDGYSHLYGGKMLKLMLGGQPEVHRSFSYNSLFVPNWIDALFLAALSTVVSSELALKLLIVLIWAALLSSLYFCIDVTQYRTQQRAQVIIVLLPISLNAYLTLGFYGFLISSSLCMFILGLVLRYGLGMSLRLQCVTSCLLLVAYFSHPLPVIVSFLVPCAYGIAGAVVHRLDGWRRFGEVLKRHAFDVWPWLPPAFMLPWFYVRLAKTSALVGAEPHANSLTSTWAHRMIHRIEALTLDVYISPTASVGILFIALLAILLAGVILRPRQLWLRDPVRFTALTILIIATLVLTMIAPDQVGDGSDIVNRFLLHSALFLVLLALTSGVFEARLLTLCSFIAALSVVVFAGEYLLVSGRLAPQVDEVRRAMETLPKNSRILVMAYRMTPSSCPGLPLLERTIPERHWALAGALKNELIVLNDYQGHTSHFPLKYVTDRYTGVKDELRLAADSSGERNRATWFEILKNDSDVDFVVSWGTSRGPNCLNPVYPPFVEALKSRYEMFFFKQGSSRVELWRKRGKSIKLLDGPR